jgi:Pyruvate/2-oxoacid:ferredoxin oxidoreductase delta subunit
MEKCEDSKRPRGSQARFCELFGVPCIGAARKHIDLIVTPLEQEVLLALGHESFTAEDADRIGGAGFTAKAYRRGVVSLEGTGPRYRAADFYTRLEIFAVAEPELYRSLDTEDQRKIDEWYFDAYYKGLEIRPDALPTADAVLTLAETLAFIEGEKRQAYLVNCDCRSLAAGAVPHESVCGKPLEVCISFRDGPNSNAHRGISRAVTKAEAKQAAIYADKAGLIHTANQNTVCNCCADCCYLSRARRRRNGELGTEAGGAVIWPRQTKRVAVAASLCSRCGLCTKRCPFGLFSLEGGTVSARAELCVGCGLCANTCPSGALELREL